MNGEQFGNRLKQIRRDNGNIDARVAAKMCGIQCSTWASYECGMSFPVIKNLIAIAKTFNVSTDWLLGLSTNREVDRDEKNGQRI